MATDSNEKVDYVLEQYSQQRRRETGPIELTPRGVYVVVIVRPDGTVMVTVVGEASLRKLKAVPP